MALYGIDLGTTFCSAAFVDDAGTPRIAPLEHGRATLPSLVLLAHGVDGAPRVTVGSLARTSFHAQRSRDGGAVLIRGAKNYIGVRAHVPGGPPWRLDGRELYATDIAALVLRAVARAIRENESLPPMEGVVVTHPQRFRNAEKLATAQAARLAGLHLAGLITEPDAAAWAYGLHERGNGPATVMVFDFGGGTLDVTLLRRDPQGTLCAVGSYGVQLGGAQIDARIADALLARYRTQTGDAAFGSDGLDDASHEALIALAESFKIDLDRDAARDPSPMLRSLTRSFRPSAPAPEAKLKVTLGELSSWIAGEIDRAVACADEALRRVNWHWNDVDEVLLTGGSSQLVALQQRVGERCRGRVQIVFDDDDHPLRPSTIVASGAALYAASLAHAHPTVLVRGVVPDAFCVRAFRPDPTVPGGKRAVLHPLIAAGTPAPYVGRARFAMRGGGRVLPVQVFEGEHDEEASCVGTYRVEFAREVPDGAFVEVELRVAPNGALTLGVRDGDSGEWRVAPLDDAPGLYSEAELDARRGWIQDVALAADPH